MIKRFNEMPHIKQIAILMLCLMNLYGIICLRYCDDNRQKLAAEIAAESGNTATEQERINRVELIAASRPDDWQPTRVYSEPGHTYYPEVLERIAKEQERAKQNAFERYLAEREMRK